MTWSFNLIVNFTVQPISSLEINDLGVSLDKFLILDRYSMKLTFGVFTTPCLLILNKKYNTIYKWKNTSYIDKHTKNFDAQQLVWLDL